jgi:hypothetical protein
MAKKKGGCKPKTFRHPKTGKPVKFKSKGSRKRYIGYRFGSGKKT